MNNNGRGLMGLVAMAFAGLLAALFFWLVVSIFVWAFLLGVFRFEQAGGTLTLAGGLGAFITMFTLAAIAFFYIVPAFMSRMSISANASTTEMIGALTASVERSNEHNAAMMNALMRITEKQITASSAPRLPAPPKAEGSDSVWIPRSPAVEPLAGVSARLELEGGRIVSVPLDYVSSFVGMARPNRESWPHSNGSYTQVATALCEMAGNPPLRRVGGGYEWAIPYEEVVNWWKHAVTRA